MKCKYKPCFAALCIAAVSFTGCSKGNAPAADITNSITSATQGEAISEKELISLEEAENAALAMREFQSRKQKSQDQSLIVTMEILNMKLNLPQKTTNMNMT